MRRKIPYRVCNCTPDGVITHLEARLLKDIVNQAIHPIRCAASCKWKYMRGMRIGDLCAETGHFLWALKVWSLTASLIESKDIDVAKLTGTSDMKKVTDLKGRPLLLFVNPWSIQMTIDRNKGLELSEFARN